MYLGIGINQAIPYNAAFSPASLFASASTGALIDFTARETGPAFTARQTFADDSDGALIDFTDNEI